MSPVKRTPEPTTVARKILEQILGQCTCELFLAYGQLLQRQAVVLSSSLRMPEASAVGSTADVRGAMVDGRVPTGRLILATAFDLIAASHPARAGGKPLAATAPGDWLYVRDWAKELANQLLGRVTNRLGNAGVVLSPGRCTALTGPVVAAELAVQKTALMSFHAGRHQLVVGLDLVLPARSEEALASGSRSYTALEGTVVFLDHGPTK